MFDGPSVDDPGFAPGALETELRAALQERSAGITTATLLRPEPPALQVFTARRPVTRWRIVGAVAAVSVVILAVVIGRGVMAPQQVRTVSTAESTFLPWAGSDPAYLTDHIWAATDIQNRVTRKSIGVGFPLWNGTSGSLPTTVEFRPDGVIVFGGGTSHITGSYSMHPGADAWSLTVEGARPSERTATSEFESGGVESPNPNSLLLEGAPASLALEAELSGDELTLSHGTTTIRYRAAGMIPDAAAVAGSVRYPIVAAIAGRWRASGVRAEGQTNTVSATAGATLALTTAGTFEIHSASSVLSGRWWATTTGLVTTDNSTTGTFQVATGTTLHADVAGLPIAQGRTPASVQQVLTAFAYGQVTVSSTPGGTLVVTDKGVPGASVMFVRG